MATFIKPLGALMHAIRALVSGSSMRTCDLSSAGAVLIRHRLLPFNHYLIRDKKKTQSNPSLKPATFRLVRKHITRR
jgi:hypothetical protein